ncbi:MAG: hypothetical protein E5X33_30980 [Mesorhizobium sp.]|uniref:hypothetical protein n=1 Tax=Mesorhizobium sp. TaxID=1871066 RepID=UPI000FE52F6B|nr:hypothetical protein [Mesorhizobium sp.]RWI94652.1 MAG: hypothetical protein EOR22_11385 [Mesorhizobium sp.]TIR15683.1 MAG: hypothetical protein E5X33_30980 [Mesorhizobium sp.]
MRTQDGYWWARILSGDDKPEIIYVGSYGGEQLATRMGDDWHYDLIECELVMPINTSAWPQKGKLTEQELLDENYAVDPTTVHDGYWWAISYEDPLPLIVRIERDSVYRIDGEDGLNDFEFLMSIDTSGWPKALPVN